MWFTNTWQTPDLTRSQIMLHDFESITFGLVTVEIQHGRRWIAETILWNFLRNCEWSMFSSECDKIELLRTWPKPSMLLQNLVRQSSCLSLSRPIRLKTWINDLHCRWGWRQDENERERERQQSNQSDSGLRFAGTGIQWFCSWNMKTRFPCSAFDWGPRSVQATHLAGLGTINEGNLWVPRVRTVRPFSSTSSWKKTTDFVARDV